jgi:ribonuclease BN (tRNA processing enzyme)
MADKEKVIGFKVDTKTAQKNIEELNKSFEHQTDLIDELEAELMQYEKMLKETSKTDLAGRKKVNDAIQKTKDRLKEEKFALKGLNKDRKDANKELKESIANQRDYSGVLGFIDQKTGGAISGFKNLISTVRGATKGFNLMKFAIIGTGVGALVIAVTALISAFKGSESGQNKFAKLMGVIGVVTGNIIDIFADLGDAIISVFENPKKAINDFASLIKKNITNRVVGLTELFPQLGKAIEQTFKGDFSGAMDTATNAIGKVTLGLESTTDTYRELTGAVGDFIDKNNEEMIMGAKVADMRSKADKVERGLLKDRALAEREVAELRLKAKDLNNTTAKERENALKKVLAIEDSLIGREQEVANLRRDAQTAENSFARSTKENLDEEERLKAEAISVETRRLNKKRQVQRELTQAENQINSEKQARLKEQQVKQAELDKIEIDKKKKLLAEEGKLEEALLDKKEDIAQRDAEGDQYEFEEKLRGLESKEIAYTAKIEELREMELISDEEFRIKKAEAEDSFSAQRRVVEEDRIIKNNKRNAELKNKERELEAEQFALDLENEQISFDDKRVLLEERRREILDDELLSEQDRNKELEKLSKANIKISEIESAQKEEAQMAYLNAVGAINNLLGEESEAGKALSVATTLVSTYFSAQKAYESQMALTTPDAPVRAGLAAGVAVASGLANVKRIMSVNAKGEKSSKGGSSGGGGGALSVSTTKLSEFQQSNFDAVGNETRRGENQATQNANAQSNTPVRAYVTASDVATGEALERSRVDVSGF